MFLPADGSEISRLDKIKYFFRARLFTCADAGDG
jgi:hypothetical protein